VIETSGHRSKKVDKKAQAEILKEKWNHLRRRRNSLLRGAGVQTERRLDGVEYLLNDPRKPSKKEASKPLHAETPEARFSRSRAERLRAIGRTREPGYYGECEPIMKEMAGLGPDEEW